MKVAYALRPVDSAASATALLLPSRDAGDLFELLERLRLEPLPAVFATADGFLVRLAIPHAGAIVGVIRLRAIAKNFYLPVDAELVPPLLVDEAEGLAKRRGLVVLAGARFLDFDPGRALEWGALLRADEEGKLGSSPPRNWAALPEPAELAEGLVELSSTVVPPSAETILEEGRDEIGTESPRPPGAPNIGQRILGTSLFVTGHLVTWLGMKLGLAGIAGKGADMLERALQKVPRLSEFLMNQQEAILRALLNDFREGRIEEALRRALPLGGPPSQPIAPGGTTLPTHSFLHSLDNLIGRRPGAAGGWFTPDDVYRSLQAEYRKHAEEAARSGDFRRAAFIYAKLLYDLLTAARVLAAGGLHRDAAIVYERALNNPRAAAAEWEAAGEIDRAVDLYVGLGDPLAAAEVLQRAGEEARALVHFHDAAMKLIVAGKHFEAGELMRTKAKRPELALALFRDGWKTRPRLGAIPCGQALATIYAEEPNPTRFRDLVRDAEASSADWGADTVAHFFDAMVRHANRPELQSVQDEVHDRCLLAMAERMAFVPGAASLFFTAGSPWPNPVVRDAQFANGHRLPVFAPRAPVELALPGRSVVRAVCRMPRSGDLFLGFDSGEIVVANPTIGTSRTIHSGGDGAVLGLEANFDEDMLVAVTRSKSGIHYALHGTRPDGFILRTLWQSSAAYPTLLLRHAGGQPSRHFGFVCGQTVQIYRNDSPMRMSTLSPIQLPKGSVTAGILGEASNGEPWVLLFTGARMRWIHEDNVVEGNCESPPAQGPKSTLHQPPLDGDVFPADRMRPAILQVTWGTRSGEMRRTSISLGGPIRELHSQIVQTPDEVPIYGVHRAPSNASRFELSGRLTSETRAGRLLNPVAAFVETGGDFLVVEANGTIRLLPRA